MCVCDTWLISLTPSINSGFADGPFREASEKVYRHLGPGRHTLADLVPWRGRLQHGRSICQYLYI